MNGYLESQSLEAPGSVVALSSGLSADVNGSRWSVQPSPWKIQRDENEQDRTGWGQRGWKPCESFQRHLRLTQGRHHLLSFPCSLTMSSPHISKSRRAFKPNSKTTFFTNPSQLFHDSPPFKYLYLNSTSPELGSLFLLFHTFYSPGKTHYVAWTVLKLTATHLSWPPKYWD